LAHHVPAALDRHAPDFVFYQAGVDALATDRLGRLRMTLAGLAERDARVLAWLGARGVPVCVMLGGGYGRPIATSAEAHVRLRAALRVAREQGPAVEPSAAAEARHSG